MKTTIYNIMRPALVGLALLTVVSCNKYLDALPDNRTEIDTQEKIKELLVSSYPDVTLFGPMEMMSDNVTDYGRQIDEGYEETHFAYKFRDVYSTFYDSPHWAWNSSYKAIASANYALRACEEYGEAVNREKGEALLCRAYAHFLLACYFCQAYNPETSGSDLGLPYAVEPEETVFVDYERGTVSEIYEKIAADIEAGFPLIDDSSYTLPAYHFTRRAAAAFASQFYLFYGKYNKAVEYADIVLGSNPVSMLRDWDKFTGTSSNETANAYVSSAEPANIFIHSYTSLSMRYRTARYCHTNDKVNETLSSPGPWGTKLEKYANAWGFGNWRHYAIPKLREYFIYTDPVAGVGEPFVVQVVYSTEKTLLNRAEANIMLGNYNEAARDLSWFYNSGGAAGSWSAQSIANYYDTATEALKKTIAPRFTVESGMQENLIHACLHARRIVTTEEGWRLMDLKRYGIAYTHVIDGGTDIQIMPYDKRLAIQIPPMAIEAGMEPNPR